ncbi:SulP family inorganic anion transporter [Microbacterium esteraromaticum]|uniref:SulP family inorganic anion transporter n=1 Tax=Microbacterium esteraromaticum TaxID=57043 RepID=UPI001C95BE84|nr:SulP family inorganic anion transporter [Microbacterium esteraromaticum]MBY6061491.1 SulP family inorganic anion transporter [Microbacterium esteraromaticum]
MADTFAAVKRNLRSYLRRFGGRKTVASDLKAGLVLGVESVPDGLAAGVLAGVNPLHGLYAYMFGAIGGALATGSAFMTVQATGAMAVIISDVSAETPGGLTPAALTTLGLIVGVIMLVLGIARLGSLVRFIPTAVLVGFVNAVAVNIVLGQIDNATGFAAEGANRIARTLDSLLHFWQWSWPTILVGVVTVTLILLLERTRLGALALVVAVIVGSGLAAALALLDGIDRVATIGDIAEVPQTLPGMQMPDLSVVLALIVPALSLALVGLVQGAAISGSIANPDGRYPDASADFRGQGIANLASGFFQGIPVGGSMSATALVRAAGARTALANLFAGVVMGITVLAFASLIGYIAMPALAALLIIVGVRTFKVHDIYMVWRTGIVQATVLTVTFVLTLLIPLQYAVLTGVGLAVILIVVQQSNRVVLRQWEFDELSTLPIESAPPATIPPGEVVVLAPYGSLFFAAAPVFEKQLPAVPARLDGAVVIVRLRGKEALGSTFLRVIATYAERVRAAGGTLMISGVSEAVHRQLLDTGIMRRIGERYVFRAHTRVGESLQQARDAAQRLIDERGGADD